MLEIADFIDANTDHLAMVETRDNGKPFRESHYDDVALFIQKKVRRKH